MRPPPTHRATTAHLQAVYPFISTGGLTVAGPLIGRDLTGGVFCFDPWELYRRGFLTNPNLLVLGQLGRGKSTFVKTLVWRQLGLGRQAWVIDPKGEYRPLAEACGTRPIVLQPGGQVRLNPLDIPGRGVLRVDEDVEALVRPRLELTTTLLSSSLGRPLSPPERTALELAVRRATCRLAQPTLGDLIDCLLTPEAADAVSVRSDSPTLLEDGRIPALELRRMVSGDLAGMFDGATSASVDMASKLVVIDVSATFSSAALPLVMTCTAAWLQASLTVSDTPTAKRLVVVDEAWSILADLATARWSQAAFKLARAYGVANALVVHRLSDLRAAGADGSTQEKLAEGLLADSETRVVFGQSPSEAEVTGRFLRLSRTETDLLTRLPRGVALWKLGGRSYLVEHIVGSSEISLVDTDSAMREAR